MFQEHYAEKHQTGGKSTRLRQGETKERGRPLQIGGCCFQGPQGAHRVLFKNGLLW